MCIAKAHISSIQLLREVVPFSMGYKIDASRSLLFLTSLTAWTLPFAFIFAPAHSKPTKRQRLRRERKSIIYPDNSTQYALSATTDVAQLGNGGETVSTGN
jgi:hypothetical protein